MMFITKDEGERRLRDYLPLFTQAIVEADNKLSAILKQDRHRVKARSTASLRNDLVVSEMKHLTKEDSRVCWTDQRGREIMWIDRDRAAIAFKQLDRQKQPSISPTQLAFSFFGQLPLLGMPDSTPRLICGWQLDMLRVQVASAMVTMPDGKTPVWYIDLDDYAEDKPAQLLPSPEPLPLDSTVSQVRPRKPVREKSDESVEQT